MSCKRGFYRTLTFLISPELPQFWDLINEDNAKMLFPWKRDLLKIRHEDVENWEDTLERSSQSTKPTAITKPDFLPDNPEATQIMLIAEKRSLYEKPQPTKESQYPTTIVEATKRSKISDRLKPNHILTEFTDRKLNASLLKLSRTASESEQEHGLSTLFLSFGNSSNDSCCFINKRRLYENAAFFYLVLVIVFL